MIDLYTLFSSLLFIMPISASQSAFPSSVSIQVLHQLLQPERDTRIVDIGSNPIDGEPEYWPLLQLDFCSVLGFEPQEDALQKLRDRAGPKEQYLPYVIADGQPATLHVCQAQGMTSLLKPTPETCRVFRDFTRFGSVLKTIPVQTKRLDDIPIDEIDLLKIDVQGMEYCVFQNATETLKKVIMIQTEVSFLPLYEEQPLFSEIDLFLRSQGFVPHCFAQINTQPVSPLTQRR